MPNPVNYAHQAAAWVNQLVPGKFEQASALIDESCEYDYSGETLKGPAIIRAFVSSHERALAELDAIEYLEGELKDFGPNGALIGVADRISLNDKTHIYRDQLLVKMALAGDRWSVVQLKHLPLSEEKARLKEFLEACGPKRQP